MRQTRRLPAQNIVNPLKGLVCCETTLLEDAEAIKPIKACQNATPLAARDVLRKYIHVLAHV